MKRSVVLLCFLLLMALLVACNGGDEDDSEPEDPAALLQSAADELDQADSFQLVLSQSGAPTLFVFEGFESLNVAFNDAVATFVSPNAVQANLRVSIDAATQRAEIISVEDRQYVNQGIITGGEWQQQVLVENFQPADLQSEERGIGSALRAMSNVEFIGNIEKDSLAVYHIRGNVPAELLRSVTVGLMATDTGDIVTDVFIRRDNTNRVAFIELQEPSPADSEEDLSKTWEIEFRGYNQEYTINEPDVAEAS